MLPFALKEDHKFVNISKLAMNIFGHTVVDAWESWVLHDNKFSRSLKDCDDGATHCV
jgi:hypothetical protein